MVACKPKGNDGGLRCPNGLGRERVCGTFHFSFACKVSWSDMVLGMQGPDGRALKPEKYRVLGDVRRGSREDLFASLEMALTNSEPLGGTLLCLGKLRGLASGEMEGPGKGRGWQNHLPATQVLLADRKSTRLNSSHWE